MDYTKNITEETNAARDFEVLAKGISEGRPSKDDREEENNEEVGYIKTLNLHILYKSYKISIFHSVNQVQSPKKILQRLINTHNRI